MYTANNLSPTIKKSFDLLKKQSDQNTPWKQEINQILYESSIPQDENNLFSLIHKKQHIEMIFSAFLENEEAIFCAYQNKEFKNWTNFRSCDADQILLKNLGLKMFNGDPNQGDKPLIRSSEYSQEVSYEIFRQSHQQNLDFDIYIEDPLFINYLKSQSNSDGAYGLGKFISDKYLACNRAIGVLCGVTEKPAKVFTANKEQQQAYNNAIKAGQKRTLNDLFYTLTVMPTHQDAINANIPYNEFTTMYLEMCDQPDKEVQAAQEKLIQKFNAAKKLRITNSDGTDISMDLYDEEGPFTFANSVTAKNIPGSEFFSAPAKYSVNGCIVAKGRFIGNLNKHDIIEDITLVFKNGEIIFYDAVKGFETLKENIEHNKESRFLGEIAFGTNSACQQHVANSLMCEKIGGSFHIAIGNAFQYTEYCGKPIRVNNGNKSDDGFHWDVTTMLIGKEGRVMLDDVLVMENGLWIGDEFDVLNRGWQAIPFEERPPYWQKKFPKP